MKHSLRLFVLLTVAAWTLPAFAGVSVDFDTDNDFGGYGTYAWKPGTAVENPMIHKRIEKAIDTQLQAKGLRRVEGQADVYVVYHAAMNEARRVDVNDFGYRGRWGGGGSVHVYDVTVGTLVVDLLDGASMDLVWRGRVEKQLSSKPTPEKMEKRLNKIAGKLFKDYPPQ